MKEDNSNQQGIYALNEGLMEMFGTKINRYPIHYNKDMIKNSFGIACTLVRESIDDYQRV